MTTNSDLSASHQRTYERLFQHPLPHNLEWHDVRTMLAQLGQLTDEANGHIDIVRNGHTLVLHRPHTKDLTDEHELMALRHFIERSASSVAPPGATGTVVVEISHNEARIFRSDAPGTRHESIRSHDPRHFGHAADSKENARGKELPAPSSLFGPLAATLKDVPRILLFGCGTGKASEMDAFVAWLKTHHPDLAGRIVGSVVVDESHLTADQLLTKARQFFAQLATEGSITASGPV